MRKQKDESKKINIKRQVQKDKCKKINVKRLSKMTKVIK